MPSKVILIRHGEKPSKDGSIQGVDPSGSADKDSLSVRGWQRSGALARYFAAIDIAMRPTALFAAAPGSVDASNRAEQTLHELGLVLGPGVAFNTRLSVGQEADLAARVLDESGVVLVAWEHKAIHLIGDALVGNNTTVPRTWDGTRFDLMYVFSNTGNGWSFEVAGQFLLSGDLPP